MVMLLNPQILFNRNETRSSKLKYVLENEWLCNVFEGYLKEHHAWEIFGFYCAVKFFKEASDFELQQTLAKNIHSFYLSEDAIFKLNASSDTTDNILLSIESSLGSDDLRIVFDDLMDFSVMGDLTNSLLEFIESLQYPEVHPTQSLKKDNSGVAKFLQEVSESQSNNQNNNDKRSSRRLSKSKGSVGIFSLYKSLVERF